MENATYKRKITPWERMMNRSPYSVLSMLIRVRGSVTEEMVRNAVNKVQQRHTLLRVRIEFDEQQNPWFTSEDVQEIPIEVLTREDDNSWIEIYDKACKQPFDFEKRPAIRFYFLKSEKISDIIIFCHHIICDGMSLAYLARDCMIYLGKPELEVEKLPDPLPLNRDSIPKDQKLGGLILKIIDRINEKWDSEKVNFDHNDYFEIHKAYWNNFRHKTISLELMEEETLKLVKNCKDNKVSVNSAITTAFVGAQRIVQGKKPYHSKIGIAGDLRTRLTFPVGEAIGFYAGLVTAKFEYDPKKSMWENARAFHQKVTKMYTDKRFLADPLIFTALDPSIMESRFYKILGNLVQPESPRYEKLSEFNQRSDTVSGLLKRGNMESIENVIMGTAITNLTQMNFPQKYGDLELVRLIMQPGGGFPLATVNLVIGVVTCSNKLSLLMEYAEEQIDMETMVKVKEIALGFLLPK